MLDVNESREEDDSSDIQVVSNGETAQLLKQMLPMLHDIYSIGVNFNDTVITDT